MTTPTGGRWIFSVDTTSGFSGLILGINNGNAPVFPLPVAGKFNIEVFTNPTVAGLAGNPNPDAGFQSTMTDPNGTIDSSGLLTGTSLRLGTGDFLAVDSIGGSSAGNGSKMTLGSGKQTVVGAKFDTLVGGQAPGVGQILSALIGNETVIGGTSNESIWGGANDSIVAGTGANNQIVVSGTGTTVVAGLSGNAVIALAANNTVTSLAGSTQNVIIGAGTNDLIDLTGNTAATASICPAALGRRRSTRFRSEPRGSLPKTRSWPPTMPTRSSAAMATGSALGPSREPATISGRMPTPLQTPPSASARTAASSDRPPT